jgi:hypothetical protein
MVKIYDHLEFIVSIADNITKEIFVDDCNQILESERFVIQILYNSIQSLLIFLIFLTIPTRVFHMKHDVDHIFTSAAVIVIVMIAFCSFIMRNSP